MVKIKGVYRLGNYNVALIMHLEWYLDSSGTAVQVQCSQRIMCLVSLPFNQETFRLTIIYGAAF